METKTIDLKNGYFDINYYLDKLNLTWDDDFCLIICSHKNTGKSTSIWNSAQKEVIEKRGKQVAYLRTNISKQLAFRDGFNKQFENKYMISSNSIWKLCINEEGEEIRKNRVKVGSVHGIANQENNASGFFNDYQLVFWDEFNEKSKSNDLWKDFNILLKTIQRNNKPFQIILCGNRIDGDNDILVNMEVEHVDHFNEGEDYIQKLHPIKPIYYIDVNPNHFQATSNNQKDSIVNVIASMNEDTDRFINNGGFLKMRDKRIILHKHIKEYKQILIYIIIQNVYYEYGKVFDSYYVHKTNDQDIQEGIDIVALDNLSYINNTNSQNFINENEYVEFAQKLKDSMRYDKIIFTSNQAKEVISTYVNLMTSLIDY